MTISTYDSCLLYATNGFGVIGLQTDNSLILGDDAFTSKKEHQLQKANLMAKEREQLTETNPIRFNGGYISQEKDESLYPNQERQCKGLRLVALKESMDLVSARGMISKSVTPKDQYVA